MPCCKLERGRCKLAGGPFKLGRGAAKLEGKSFKLERNFSWMQIWMRHLLYIIFATANLNGVANQAFVNC